MAVVADNAPQQFWREALRRPPPRPSADARIVDVDCEPRLNVGVAQINTVTPLFRCTRVSPNLARITAHVSADLADVVG